MAVVIVMMMMMKMTLLREPRVGGLYRARRSQSMTRKHVLKGDIVMFLSHEPFPKSDEKWKTQVNHLLSLYDDGKRPDGTRPERWTKAYFIHGELVNGFLCVDLTLEWSQRFEELLLL